MSQRFTEDAIPPPEREPPAKIHTGSVRSRDALISGGIGSAGARSDVSPGIWFGGPAGGDRTSPLYPSPCAARRASASPLLVLRLFTLYFKVIDIFHKFHRDGIWEAISAHDA